MLLSSCLDSQGADESQGSSKQSPDPWEGLEGFLETHPAATGAAWERSQLCSFPSSASHFPGEPWIQNTADQEK